MASAGNFNGSSLGKDEKSGFLQPSVQHALQGFTAEAKKQWLEAFEETAHVKKTCKAIGVSYQTWLNHLAHDEEFRKEYRHTLDAMENELSGSMFDRGKKGSFIHAIAWLRAHFPEKWGNKSTIQHKSDDKRTDELMKDVIDVTPLPTEGQDQA